jgi:hypothetical protein
MHCTRVLQILRFIGHAYRLYPLQAICFMHDHAHNLSQYVAKVKVVYTHTAHVAAALISITVDTTDGQ